MPKSFDIALDRLGAPVSAPALAEKPAPLPLRGAASAAPAGKSFYIETFGCQMNDHDTEKVEGVLLARGYQAVANPAHATLVLYNTCSIREKAAQKVFSRIGDWKTLADGKIVGVLGCVAQQEGEAIFERAPWVSLVCGSASYTKLPDLLDQVESGHKRVTGLSLDTDQTFETELTRRDNIFRAYITIIEGCDYSCSYCVVPKTRGPERSRRSDAVLAEAHRLAEQGFTEIQLLGQTVNSYRDSSPAAVSFVDLLKAIAAVPGIRRVRFTTSHPNDFHQGIIDAIYDTQQLCDHIHLPVQSGSTRILKAMRRTYTRAEYLAKVAMIRAAERPISITSDVIVGFPGETEEDFADTLSMLDAAQYDGVYAFKYSPRPNTPAQHLEDAIPEDEKSRRLAILMERQRNIQIARNEALVGQVFEVHTDGHNPQKNIFGGRTTCNRLLNFTSPLDTLLGKYLKVRVTRAAPNNLFGEHITEATQ
jgi:tRNA-2-methylthio-N6-dimethylallyladenosine synthase